MSSLPCVCVASANRWEFSQTFIRAHIERLPARVKVLGAFHGGYGDAQVVYSFRLARLVNELSRRIRGRALTVLPGPGVRRFLRRHNVRVVLAEFGPTAALLAGDCAACNVPLVAHFHGYGAYSQPIVSSYEAAYRRLFQSAAAIVVVSRHMRERLLAMGAPGDKLFLNPCGVDVERFEGADPGRAPPHFLAVGRFVEKKAPHIVLEAFRRTVERHPEARLTMVGSGALFKQANQIVEELRITHAVHLPGVLPHDEVAAAMRGARAFVHHAVTGEQGDSEGTPVSVLEAAASGLPVVSTRHGGIPDFVIDARTGYVVDEYDVEGMARHMSTLAADPELAGRLGAAGRLHVREHGSMERSISRLWAIMQGAMRGSFEGLET